MLRMNVRSARLLTYKKKSLATAGCRVPFEAQDFTETRHHIAELTKMRKRTHFAINA